LVNRFIVDMNLTIYIFLWINDNLTIYLTNIDYANRGAWNIFIYFCLNCKCFSVVFS
jgi:hypothetical protein